LNELDRDGSIAIYAESIVQKKADGSLEVKKTEGDFPIRTVTGTAIGSLIGLLAGPVGAFVGAGVGTTAGFLGDAYVAGVNADFLDDVSARLTAGNSRWSLISTRSGSRLSTARWNSSVVSFFVAQKLTWRRSKGQET
jgi:uncharacterized membrane protein